MLYFMNAKSRIDASIDQLPGVQMELLAPKYERAFSEMHDPAVLWAQRKEFEGVKLAQDRAQGYADTVQVINEMIALEADWGWAQDWVDYVQYADGVNAIYMSGVYKALDDYAITY